MVDKAREIALKALYEIDNNKAFSNIVLNKLINQDRNSKKNLDDRDIAFISEIVYGTISWKLTIDEIIKKFSNIKLKKISPWILNILRMGVYQIVFLDKVPKAAAVNESVELSKKYGHKASSNFTNAVLRKIEKDTYQEFFNIENVAERISKTTSMPMWIVEELLKQKEINEVEEICKCSNMKPKLYIRVNKLKTTKQELIEKLTEQQINSNEVTLEKTSTKQTNNNEDTIQNNNKTADKILDDFLEVKGMKNLENLESFKQGLFTVQDIEAGRIPIVLEPKENEKVLDACSSPGGKTTYMAELMNNKGEIIAWDIHEHRVNLVKNAAERLGINIIKASINDATQFDEKYFEYFDKILLDVPCLGLGVLKRKPDIKWQRKQEDVEEIAKIQEKILQNCSKYLKKGGILVYSTCSILEEENEKIIENFVEKNKNFEILEKVKINQNENTDGFFISKIRRLEEKET